MKFRMVIVCLLVVVFCLVGCGKKERIEGVVQDAFGNPLKDVSVKIEKTTFTSITDGSGKYSIDYAPGAIKLIFSKENYTTINLELSIQQKSYFPAELIVLYPIPKEKGLFYIDKEKKQLVKLESNCIVDEVSTSNPGFSLTMHYRHFVKFQKPAMTIKPGKTEFIDNIPYGINIFAIKDDGLIYEGDLNMFERHDKSTGFIKDSESKKGTEGLLVREIDLSAGSYAWIEMLNTQTIGAIPKKGGAAIGFVVAAQKVK